MFLFISGIFISCIYSFFVLPNKEEREPSINVTLYPILFKGMLIIPYNKINALHLHHWVIYFFICIISIFINVPKIITGFSLGLFIQGIMYKDRLNFICKNPYNIKSLKI